MKTLTSYLYTFIILIFGVINSLAASSNRIITVGIQTESNPYEYIVANKAIGFNVDILKAIGEKLPIDFVFIQKPYSQLKQDLKNNKIDVLLMTYFSESNDTLYQLSTPYNNVKIAVFANVDQSFSIKTIDQYNLNTDIPEISTLLYQSNGINCKILADNSKREIIGNLLIENNLYYIIPEKIGSHIIDRNEIKSIWKIELDKIDLSYSFGFNKDNDSLAGLFEASLNNLLQSRIYKDITEKWFGNIDPPIIKNPFINKTTIWLGIVSIILLFLTLLYLQQKKIVQLKKENQQEIEKRKATDNAFTDNNNTINIIFNSIPYPLFVQDMQGNFLIYNDALLEILGLQGSENILEKLEKVAQNDDQYKKVFSKNDLPGQSTQKLIDANGQLKILQITKTLFKKSDTETVILTLALDISKRFKAEKKLEHESALLSSIINSIPDLIFYKDKHYRYLGGNTAFENYNNFNKEQYVGKTDFELYDTKQAIDYNNIDRIVIEENKSERIEKWGILPNGNSALFDTVKVPFRNNDGETLGLVGISRNITHQYEINKALTEAKDRAEDSDKLKTVFLANISHEIRTPLNSIIGFSDLLLDKDLTFDQQEDFIEMIRSSGNSLLQLVDDIIDLSKIESNQINIKPSPVKITQILKDVYNKYFELLQGFEYKDVKLIINSNIDTDEIIVMVDSFRIKQVLINLIGNAIRYTRHGEIHFGASFKESFIEFYVDDKEASTPEKDLDKIFERNIFSGGIENYGGSGLNLIISKGLVSLMNGELSITKGSNDKGIIISFFIPINPTDEDPPIYIETKKTHSLTNKTLLVAEDEKNNFIFIEETLRKTGINIIWAMNGREALETIASNPKIDIVLMDIKMPIMDGYTATREIKKRFPKIPIIAQTAYAMADEKTKSIEAGCDAYLTKPIRPKILIKTISDFLL